MGMGSSFRFKEAGESKELHGAILRCMFQVMFLSVSMSCSSATSGDPPKEACRLSTESLQ